MTRLRSLPRGSSSWPSRNAALNRDDQGTLNGAPPPPPPAPMAPATPCAALPTRVARESCLSKERLSSSAPPQTCSAPRRQSCPALHQARRHSAPPESSASHGAVLDGRHSTCMDTAAQCGTCCAERQALAPDVQSCVPAAVAQAAGQLLGGAGRAGAGHRRVAGSHGSRLCAARRCVFLRSVSLLPPECTLTTRRVPCGAAPGNGSDALAALRHAGTAALSAARTPTTRDEAYRFTDLSSLTQARRRVPREAAGQAGSGACCQPSRPQCA